MRVRLFWWTAARANTLEGRNLPVVVVGAGAAGIMAAISAKRRGSDVVLCDRMSRPGRKILATGNGRCNLSNDNLDSSFYNVSSSRLVSSVLSRFGKEDIKSFFESLGLRLHSEEGRIFPATNQSSSVLKILEMELNRLSVRMELNFEVSGITVSGGSFVVASKSGTKIEACAVILACGGKSYPSFGSDGSVYKIAKHFGHNIIEPVPTAVPLVTKDPLCHSLQGQRIYARTKSLIGGKVAGESAGDVLFTKYGLSGTSVIDVSREISIAINRQRRTDVFVSIDMVPFEEEAALVADILTRIRASATGEDIIAGILPNKFGSALEDVLKTKNSAIIAKALKDRRFKISGTRGWNEADFTAGGVDTSEIDERSLASKLKNGLYFAGEMLDVDGKRGGYNLAWAWASGHIAGETMVECAR